MLRVGVTGPIAGGKSTVSRLLAAEGFPVVDADRVAHELYVPGSALVAALAREFGPDILDADGGIDRKALGAIVFADPERLAVLNRLVHPVLHTELERRLDALADAGHRVAVLEAALLLTWDARALVDFVVGVDAPRETRRARLVASGRAEQANRLDAQVEPDAFQDRVDLLLHNDGPLSHLEKLVHSLAATLRRRAAAGQNPTS